MCISPSFRKHQPIALDVTIGAHYLSIVQQLIVLGGNISDDLSWNSQSHKVRAKISLCMAAVCHFGRSLNFNTRFVAFNAFIRPHLDYCLPVWGNSSLSITKYMDKVLLRCARVIHSQRDIKLSSLTMKSCGLCDFATLVFMSNVIAMFHQLRSSASSCPVQLDSSQNKRASSSNKLLRSQVKRSVDNHCFYVTVKSRIRPGELSEPQITSLANQSADLVHHTF